MCILRGKLNKILSLKNYCKQTRSLEDSCVLISASRVLQMTVLHCSINTQITTTLSLNSCIQVLFPLYVLCPLVNSLEFVITENKMLQFSASTKINVEFNILSLILTSLAKWTTRSMRKNSKHCVQWTNSINIRQ